MNPLSARVDKIDRFWCIESRWADAALAELDTIDAAMHDALFAARSRQSEAEESSTPGYTLQGSTAILRVSGPLTKSPSSWGDGCSYAGLQTALAHAGQNADVKNALMVFDTPGGQVSGLATCADALNAFKASKPVTAYVEDMCCSAGYWLASQCSHITAGATAQIGSIGTRTAVNDVSAMYAMNGVKAHSIATGEFKGAGTRGTTITAAHLMEWQREINEINEEFLSAVMSGRGMDRTTLESLADGRVYAGRQAVTLGLIDAVGTLDSVLSALNKPTSRKPSGMSAATSGTERKPIVKNAWNLFLAAFKANGGEVTAEDEAAAAATFAAQAAMPTAVPAKAAEPSADVTALKALAETQSAQISALTALVQAQTVQAANDKAETRLTANRARIRTMVNQMKLIPAAATQWETMASEKPDAFEAAFGIVEATAKPDRSVLRDRLVSSGAGAENDTSDPGGALTARANARMKTDKIGFTEALRLVSSENPDLARAHAEDVRTVAGNPTD